MNTTTENEKPDHQLAAEELQALWTSLKLTAEVTPLPATKDESGWAHVPLRVVVSNGKAAESFDYRMGVGLVNWKTIAALPFSLRPRLAEEMARYSSRLTKEAQIDACSQPRAQRAFRKACKPWEVLASVCRDAEDASTQSFEDWADCYGYEKDSRKAEATYFLCQSDGKKVRRLIGGKDAQKFAELASRL